MTRQEKKSAFGLQVSLHEGRQAEKLLANPSFITEWQNLARKMEIVTVIQEPPFVLTWYRQYAEVFRPVLAVGRDSAGKLVGFVPLAFAPETRELAHAGAWQGEYHGWICDPGVEQDLLIQTLILIKNRFSLVRNWPWRWMPPGANTNWLRSKQLAQNGIFVRTIEQEPPVLDLTNETKIRKIQRNKSLRAKMNRYRRKGTLRLERITSPGRAAAIFDDLVLQTDFRQMAVHGEMPFAGDLHKKEFYLARLQFPASNHFTVLWFNERPLAYHFGACDETTVYLGLTGYDPRESKNSPGILLLLQLIDLLREEGFRYFDLTPGEDVYKARLGSTRRKVVEPTFFFNRRDKIVADVKSVVRLGIKKGLLLLGIDLGKTKRRASAWANFFRRLRASNAREAAAKIGALFYRKKRFIYLEIKREAWKSPLLDDLETVRFQHYPDLLLFQSRNPWRTQQDVFAEAIQNFSRGEKLATFVENGKLRGFGWMSNFSELTGLWKKTLEGVEEGTKKRAILLDFYWDSSADPSHFKQFLARMTTEIFNADLEKIGLILQKNSALKKGALAIGFVPAREIKMAGWLGKNFCSVRQLQEGR